jgi:hypothetical protein
VPAVCPNGEPSPASGSRGGPACSRVAGSGGLDRAVPRARPGRACCTASCTTCMTVSGCARRSWRPGGRCASATATATSPGSIEAPSCPRPPELSRSPAPHGQGAAMRAATPMHSIGQTPIASNGSALIRLMHQDVSVAQLLIPVGWASLWGEVEQVPQRLQGPDVALVLPWVFWCVKQFGAPEVADSVPVAVEHV